MTQEMYRSSNHSNNNNNNTYKFKLDCSGDMSSVSLIQKFDHHSSDFKIFQGLLDERKKIVVKVGTISILQKEYRIGKQLFESKLPNFIDFYCLLECKNKLSKVNVGTTICNNTETDDIGGLIMPLYSLGEIEKYKWNRENFDVLKNVIKHVCCTLLYTFTVNNS